jgi:hypothetical protein
MGRPSFWPVVMILMLWEKTLIPKRKTQALLDPIKEVGLDVNPKKTKFVLMSHS